MMLSTPFLLLLRPNLAGYSYKSEKKLPNLEEDIKELVGCQSQPAPKMQSTFAYTQISVRAVREALMLEKGYEKLVTRQTIGEVMNRMGYCLKKHKN